MKKTGAWFAVLSVLFVFGLTIFAHAGDLPSVPLTGEQDVSIPEVSTEYEISLTLPTDTTTTTAAFRLDQTDIRMIYLETTVLHANAAVADWKSDDTGVVTVDRNGNLKAVGKGDAKITAAAADGREAVCTVHVRYTFWQLLIRYLLFGWIWY